MKIFEPHKRLKKFWGEVDRKHISLISKHIIGNSILDLGCGFGTTTNYIKNNLNLSCTGIDFDEEVISLCKETYPDCDFMVADAEELPFENNSFDTIILRDALHHFYQEADFEKVKNELIRVSKDKSRIIFFDPNINFILKSMRKLASHNDAECDYETALRIQDELGLKIIHKKFNTLFSLPLSGGYVGLNLVPDLPPLHKFIIGLENLLEKIVNPTGLGRYLCWRYLIVGEIKED
ncbi:MAG: class I SAM-dependent methyltransferase [Candidatus Delongbacteria bacterium]|nr:class I SAM-dependent methyltransferase [Candidatus Delongbacteria bacterium]